MKNLSRSLSLLAALLLTLAHARAGSAQATAPAETHATRADVSGRVVDVTNSTPLDGAVLRIPGLRLTAVTDSLGRFAFHGLPAGTNRWEIHRLGYTAWQEDVEAEDGDSYTVALLPRPQVLAGLTVRTEHNLTQRRSASSMSVRVVDRMRILNSAFGNAKEILASQVGLDVVPCTRRAGNTLAPDTRVLGGFGVPRSDGSAPAQRLGGGGRTGTAAPGQGSGPPPEAAGPEGGSGPRPLEPERAYVQRTGEEANCAIIKGQAQNVKVYIDERQATGGLAELEALPAQEIYLIESFDGGRMVRVYTVDFAERLARGQAELLPLNY
jgi:hypothetical protein